MSANDTVQQQQQGRLRAVRVGVVLLAIFSGVITQTPWGGVAVSAVLAVLMRHSRRMWITLAVISLCWLVFALLLTSVSGYGAGSGRHS